MRADLASIREGLSSPEARRLIDERPSLSALSNDITAAIVLLECAEAKLFNLLPMEELPARSQSRTLAAERCRNKRLGRLSPPTTVGLLLVALLLGRMPLGIF
jgi:hypothetical protein